mgnify:CR=1 FL=1
MINFLNEKSIFITLKLLSKYHPEEIINKYKDNILNDNARNIYINIIIS